MKRFITWLYFLALCFACLTSYAVLALFGPDEEEHDA